MKKEPSLLSSCRPQFACKCCASAAPQLEILLTLSATWTSNAYVGCFYSYCVMLYRLSCLKPFQGIAMPTFMANTWTESIAMLVMPAFCNRDILSSSLKVSTSSSIRADGSPPLTMLLAVCISARLVFTVLEQAAEVRWRALVTCMNVIGYKVWFSVS